MLEALGSGRLIAIDQDPDARENVWEDDRFQFIAGNFQFIDKLVRLMGIQEVDGILADLGISSHQIDAPGRGFSYRFAGPLDMRMDKAQSLTAAEVINAYPPEELVRVFARYGEIAQAGRLVRAVMAARAVEEIRQTTQLVGVVEGLAPPGKRAKFLSQVFQALRIEVNREMEVLELFLQAALRVLKPGGRLAVIAYHSLEDRMVKHFFRSGNFDDRLEKDVYGNPLTPWKRITRKAVVPTQIEIQQNPRARSAKLRVAEKI